jgi:hypothetical protein
LQHALYRAAKANPRRRFHALRDKVYREDVLQRAWHAVRRNNSEIRPAPHLWFDSHGRLASWVALCPDNYVSA